MKYGNTTIGGMSFGSTMIGGAKYGDTLVFKKGGSELPSGYERLTYVETPLYTKAYINTGITATNATGFEIDALTNDAIAANSFGCLFGSRAASNSSDFQLSTYTGTSGWSGTLRRGTSTHNFNAHIPAGTRFKAKLIGNDYSISGTSYTTVANITSGKTIYLFALNDNGTASQHGHLRVYGFKLFSGTTKILDYVPCIRSSDKVVGFYDRVNSSFVTPTSGDLYGVDESNTSYDSAVDYIEFDGNQAVNVGVGASAGHTIVEIQCQYTDNLSATQIAVGTYYSGGQWFGNVGGQFAVGGSSNQKLSSSSTKTVITGSYLSTSISIKIGTQTANATRSTNIELPMYIGQGGSSGLYRSSVKVWYVKIYTDTTLIRDLIPVEKDGVGYFYDRITGLLFGSSTTSPLIASND